MIGQTVSHFRVIAELGSGGMGVVYRAEDLRLGRMVALKFLPRELSTDASAKARFVTEAKATSALDHPSICTVYEIDETADGRLFIAMACYEGETLKARLARDLPTEGEATRTVEQVALGLARVHEFAIVHRDIKPANIFLCRDGQVKLLDFGVAKLAGQTRVTRTGSLVGTVCYMSPEQVQGTDVDARSDLFSLGVVFYEMLTGVLPFRGDNPTAVLFAILHSDPPAVATLNRGLSTSVQMICARALAKRPDRRYQSAAELLDDLARVARGGEPIPRPRPSIAVLPFDDLSPDRDQGYFCDGIVEDLINDLAHLEDLRVVARSSAFAFRGRQTDVQEIGRRLDVPVLLTGSIRKVGNRLRVNVQLVDAADSTQLWSERYDRDLTDVFAIQDEIVLAVVAELKVKLFGAEHATIEKEPAVGISTYNLYLKGRYHWNERTESGLREAIEYFDEAIAREPNFVLAHVGLAESYNMLGAYGYCAPGEVYPRVKSAARRALDIDPANAEAHASLGWALYEYDWDWPGAEREFRCAIELKPGYSVARMWYAHFLMLQGRLDEAIREFENALLVDPLALIAHANIGCCHHFARRHDQAKDILRATLEMNAGFLMARIYLGWTLLAEGNPAAAIEELRRAIGEAQDYSMAVSSLGYAYGVAGDRDAARATLEQLERLAAERHIPAFDSALVHLGLGDTEMALQGLEIAVTNREMWISYLKMSPLVDRLRCEPRFQRVLARAGLASGTAG